VLIGAALLLRQAASARPAGLVVLYHRIEQDSGDAARELVPAVGVREFRRELRWLRRLFRVVAAADILEASNARRRWQRLPLAITFDDEWPTHASLALAALRAERLAATFFLTGAPLQGAGPFWWESLQEATDAGAATATVVDGPDIFAQAATITAARAPAREAMSMALGDLAGPATRSGMTASDVLAVAGEHDVGFHTIRHHSLLTLTAAELERALREGRGPLEGLLGRPTELLAYPHGAAGPREARAAERAGFTMAFTTHAAPCGQATDPLLVGRLEPGAVALGTYLRMLAGCLRLPSQSGSGRATLPALDA
jgi:peptidoglycan/xylan/chitin deacetylase (PgdA/CDA1 family)